METTASPLHQKGRPLLGYVLFWLVIVLITGSFSNWIFHLLYQDQIVEKNYWIGFVNAGVFAAAYMGLFYVNFRWSIRRFPPFTALNGLIHVGIGVGNLVATMLFGYFMMPLISSLVQHTDVAQKTQLELGIISLIVLNCGLVLSGVSYIGWYVRQQAEAREARVRSELAALRAQINPHFLFNAMNTIAALVRKDANLAEEVVLDLADVFRYVLASSRKDRVSLAEELHLVRMYLNIEKARFSGRLDVRIEAGADVERFQVPSLMLQPLVENSIKHSVAKSAGHHWVEVKAGLNPEGLCICVRDSGSGFAGNDLEAYIGRGTGLTNVKRLLELSFPGRHRFRIKEGGLEIQFLNDDPTYCKPYASLPG